MDIIATHINYYSICRRKLRLFANAIQMEHTSDTVYDGKLLHESSYPASFRPKNLEHIQLLDPDGIEKAFLIG